MEINSDRKDYLNEWVAKTVKEALEMEMPL